MSRCPKQCLNLQVKEAWDMQNELYLEEGDTEEDIEEVEEVAKHKLGLRNISVAGVTQWNRLRSGYLRNLDNLTNQYHESVARMYVNRMWKTHMQVQIEEEEEMHLRAIGRYDYIIEHNKEETDNKKEKTEEEMVPDYYRPWEGIHMERKEAGSF